jgi:hypothetical protein
MAWVASPQAVATGLCTGRHLAALLDGGTMLTILAATDIDQAA